MNIVDKKFWIVTKPTAKSTIKDMLFEADLKDLSLQFLGGLNAKDIVGLFTEKHEAADFAVSLLAAEETK